MKKSSKPATLTAYACSSQASAASDTSSPKAACFRTALTLFFLLHEFFFSPAIQAGNERDAQAKQGISCRILKKGSKQDELKVISFSPQKAVIQIDYSFGIGEAELSLNSQSCPKWLELHFIAFKSMEALAFDCADLTLSSSLKTAPKAYESKKTIGSPSSSFSEKLSNLKIEIHKQKHEIFCRLPMSKMLRKEKELKIKWIDAYR
ncbi:MAG: hypothetical protein K2X27_17340 [Candidatus Obscuribacterales bacterium]|nr:hypothetical protein [Candidatus Obscuribacterales bacterium]